MKPKEIKKRCYTKVENVGNIRYVCRFCNKSYKENVTRMTMHIKNECKKVPQCISKCLLSFNKSKFNHRKLFIKLLLKKLTFSVVVIIIIISLYFCKFITLIPTQNIKYKFTEKYKSFCKYFFFFYIFKYIITIITHSKSF